MRVLHDPPVRTAIRSRVQALTPDAPRRWGKMTVDQMLWHVNTAMEMAIGSKTFAPRRFPPPHPRHYRRHPPPHPRMGPSRCRDDGRRAGPDRPEARRRADIPPPTPAVLASRASTPHTSNTPIEFPIPLDAQAVMRRLERHVKNGNLASADEAADEAIQLMGQRAPVSPTGDKDQ